MSKNMTEPGLIESQAYVISPDAGVGVVALKVADLSRSLDFYTRRIGLELLHREGQATVMGMGRRPILKLIEVPGALRQPPSTTGLYHAAILWPDRRSLAIKIAQISAAGVPLGQADHLVSEAFYLSDPDGNGLELYRDRPRQEWSWQDRRVRMAIDPIDFDSFFAEIRDVDPALSTPSAPEGTRLGHVHLRVADIALAEDFYHGVLGFEVTAKLPGALFVSAGGYHHHLGMNTWESRGGQPPAEPTAGLKEFSIVLPDRSELDLLADRIETAGLVAELGDDSLSTLDPFKNRVQLITQALLK